MGKDRGYGRSEDSELEIVGSDDGLRKIVTRLQRAELLILV